MKLILTAVICGALIGANAQSTNTPGIRGISSSNAGALTNVLYVSKAGNDTSGRRNLSTLPFKTIGAAKAAAVAGDTIVIGAGNYNENNLLKVGVNYRFDPGASLTYTSTTYTVSAGYGFFDDRATGATTNKITGYFDFYYSCGSNLNNTCHGNTNCAGGIVMTNPATLWYGEFGRTDGDAFLDCNGPTIDGFGATPACFYIARCQKGTEFRVLDMPCIRANDTANFGGPNLANAFNGLYWENGDLYFRCSHYGFFAQGQYAIWSNTRTDTAENLWVTGDLCEGYIYNSMTSSKNKCWYDFKELRGTNSNGGAMNMASPGRVYLRAEKISGQQANTPVLSSISGSEFWVTAQKISYPAGGAWLASAGGTNWLDVQQFETPTGLFPAAFTLTAGAVLNLQGETVWSGNSGGQALAASTTCFYALGGNSATNLATSDVSAFTRTVLPKSKMIYGLSVIRDAAGGVGHTTTVTVMTNGVASSIVASLNNSLTGSDFTHYEVVPDGCEVGIKIVTPASDTPGKHSWSLKAH